MTHKTILALASAALAFFLFSCTLGAALTPRPTATPTPEPSATPLPSPTATLLVDLTPPTPLPTATIPADSPEWWACQVRWQVPRNGAKFAPRERFDVGWQVVNEGYSDWEPDTVRLAYFSGRRMQMSDSVPLKDVVPPDVRTQLLVPMVAPRAIGRYTTVWALWHGDNHFCHMTVTIVVR